MMGINAVKGFEYGSGFAGAVMKGSEHNDEMQMNSEKRVFKSNRSGGVQGGISNGEDIYFRVAFKPVASISSAQQTIDKSNKDTTLELKGRHDPCVVPRAVPIVEAMAWMVMADFWLLNRTNRI
jgi:chorismate synthase